MPTKNFMKAKNDKLELTRATQEHMEILFSWRNEPNVYRYFKSPKPIEWNEHLNWFNEILKSHSDYLFLARLNDEYCGVIRYKLESDSATISITISPHFQGMGIASKLLLLGEKEEHLRQCRFFYAEINEENVASQNAFKKAGFKKVKDQTWLKLAT